MLQLYQIYKGWKNYIFKDPEVESIAKDRAKLCAPCLKYRHGAVLAWVGDDIETIQAAYCNICKCPLSALLRNLDKQCSDTKAPKWLAAKKS